MSGSDGLAWRSGGCHCGAVRFEVQTSRAVTVSDCNCSMCARTGFQHIIVPESRFRILQGADNLTTYTFNTGVARHLFCATCGIKAFYRPRSNPDGWSVNAKALDHPEDLDITIEPFDGQNWETHAASLAHLSQEGHA